MATTAFLWLIALPLVSAPVIYLAGKVRIAALSPEVALTNGTGSVALHEEARGSLAWWTALVVLLVTWLPFAAAVQTFSTEGIITVPIESVALRLDGVSLLLSGLALGLGTLVTLYSGPYISGEAHDEKYYALLTAMVGMMIGLACAGDLFNLWLWFEAMAVASYLLVAFYREQPASLEAGVKYLMQSAAGSILVLIGIALVLAQTGTLNLTAIATAVEPAPMLLAAGALFTIGFGVKVAMVPMHTWLPDAHAQAPSGISAMLSGVVIEAGLVALLRVLAVLAGVTLSWGLLLLGFGALNMLAGNLLALRQTQVKRLLAYSSLAHIGYMLLGFGIALYAGQAAGAEGGFFHMLTHGMMKGLAFLAAGSLLYVLHIANDNHSPLTIKDLAGAATRYPLVALTLSVALLGLGGLPPLAGFMSKWQIFVAGFATQNLLIQALVVFAALNSVLSLAYYAPIVNALYREQPSLAVRRGASVPAAMLVPLVLLAVAIVAVGIWPALLGWLTQPAGAALMAAIGG